MHDPLAQYRRPSALGSAKAPPPTVEEYTAFGTKDRVARLRIRSRMEPVHSPGYNLLLDVVYDGEFGTNIVLAYTVLHVMVRGRNLQKLVYAIENGMADFIQEFDPDRWEKPTDANAPIIESIEIRAIENDSSKTEH